MITSKKVPKIIADNKGITHTGHSNCEVKASDSANFAKNLSRIPDSIFQIIPVLINENNTRYSKRIDDEDDQGSGEGAMTTSEIL